MKESRRSNRSVSRPSRAARLRSCLGVLLFIIVIAAVAAVFIGWYTLYQPDSEIVAGAPVEITIAKGSSTATIAQTLSDAGVVTNELMFRLTARQSEVEGKLRAGSYTLATGMPDELVIKALLAGPKIVTYEVPIPEGFTARQIAARFADRGQIPEAELLELVTKGAPKFAETHPAVKDAYRDSLEGYLFPATYTVREGATAETVVDMMLDKFDSEMETIDLGYAKSKKLTSAEVIIIASILEREARLEKEYPLVASVIYNRLKMPMRLQLCATVMYEMPAGTNKLTIADTKRDTPYNTYAHDGLPPGPISNPGRRAIEAAAHPPKTKYLYYVLTGKDGSQTFASSYSEFLRAKAGAK